MNVHAHDRTAARMPDVDESAMPAAPSGLAQTTAVAERSLRDRWRSLLVWSLALAGISAVELAVYPSIKASSQGWRAMLDQWPDALKEAFRLDAYGSGPGFLNTELFSMIFPIVLIAVALGAAAAATAGEEERGTADILLSLPIPRGRFLAGKVVAMLLGVLAVAAAGAIAIVLGAPLVDLSVGTPEVLAASAATMLLALVFGSFGLLLGALTGRRGPVLGGGIGLAMAAFLLQVLAPMADWLEPWQRLSPFYWALHDEPLVHGLGLDGVVLLVVVPCLMVTAAAVAFHRRDIRGR